MGSTWSEKEGNEGRGGAKTGPFAMAYGSIISKKETDYNLVRNPRRSE